ncbi:LOW QUALITY PROTEIN: interferon-induced GTP-binding protein Mx2-like [Liasis olivaceus]
MDNIQSPERKRAKKEAENNFCSQYEEKVHPCIDLIDSLRSLGVEKDLALLAVAVIGDQSSGKSSVLEALSGVALPRGIGIVTRCPLELKLKKTHNTKEWKGKIVYPETQADLNDPSEVEAAVRRAQNAIAGEGQAISNKLITLEISSPDVPDLTLIDLPGIIRVAIDDQPQDIGDQIMKLIKSYITKQETINLIVVPSNVDIATTEALKMAEMVDPQGERTLGILTKPDLVDKGTENEIVRIVRNERVYLKKGYMICRSQHDLINKLSLADAIKKEREFFEEHNFFRPLLEEGIATIPLLAERLTQELIEHIQRSLPALDQQIKDNFQKTNEELQKYGEGVPESLNDKNIFLVKKIRHFNEDLSRIVQGDEDMQDLKDSRTVSDIRKSFDKWQCAVNDVIEVNRALEEDIEKSECTYRGRELPGFVNYKNFENIVRQQIKQLESPAIKTLKDVSELVRKAFINLAKQHFKNYSELCKAALSNIEEIKLTQVKAEDMILTQFKLEEVVYCQDNIYSEDLKDVREKTIPSEFSCENMNEEELLESKNCSKEMLYHLTAYYKSVKTRLGTQIPMIIDTYVFKDFAGKLQESMLQLLQDRDKLGILLHEKKNAINVRNCLKERIKRLYEAQEQLAKYFS